MKKQKVETLLSIFFLLFISQGCGSHSPSEATHVVEPIVIKIQMPSSMAKDTTRYRRFIANASHLEISLSTKRGTAVHYSFAAPQWDNLPIPSIDWVEEGTDSLLVKAQIWDRKGGALRSYPVLIGKAQLHARDRQLSGPTLVIVKLTLQVKGDEFD